MQNQPTMPGTFDPIDILAQRARELARREAINEDTSTDLHLLAFRLGPDRFAVDLEAVQEVQPLDRLNWSRVPCTPDFIVGAVNIRGHIYSIMHLGPLLGIEKGTLSRDAHLVLVRSGKGDSKTMALSLVCDNLPTLEQVRRDAIQPATGNLSPRTEAYARGVTSNMLTILDLEKLLSDPQIIIADRLEE